jgi:hypothetical protein
MSTLASRPMVVHRVAGRHDGHDLVGIAVNDRHLAGVAERHRKEVLDVAAVLWLRRAIIRLHDQLPAGGHLRQAELRRGRRFVLQVACHDVDLLIGEVTGGPPVRHAGGGTVSDQGLQVIGALLARDVRGQWLAGRALAQHAVAAGTTLEIDLGGGIEFDLGHRRTFRVDESPGLTDRARRTLVSHFTGTADRVVCRPRHDFPAAGGGDFA